QGVYVYFLLLLIDKERRPEGRLSHFLVAADMIIIIGRANSSKIQLMRHLFPFGHLAFPRAAILALPSDRSVCNSRSKLTQPSAARGIPAAYHAGGRRM